MTAATDARMDDVDDLERVYRDHRLILARAARRWVGPADAETVIQEVFVELLRNPNLRQRFQGGSVTSWLTEIARRKAYEHLRRHGREIPSSTHDEPVGASPEDEVLSRDLLDRFVARHVPVPQRDFFRVRFVEHRTQMEAAAQLGLARSTLEGWEHRLSDALRRFLLEVV